MRPRRPAVATYLQTFILIAVALGGSLIAYREVSAYANSAGGPGVQVWGASLKVGSGVSVERLTVSNSGTSDYPFVSVLNPDLPPAGSYCYTVASVKSAHEAGSCPSLSLDPASIRITADLTPGATIVVTIFLQGCALSQGTEYPLLVTAPGAAVVSEQVVASPG